jgi:hypothetical protein
MEGHLLGDVFAFAGLIGSAPLFLLFWDHPRAWHKPVIFILALVATFAWLIPAFIDLCGIWSAIIAPLAMVIYPFLTRRKVG